MAVSSWANAMQPDERQMLRAGLVIGPALLITLDAILFGWFALPPLLVNASILITLLGSLYVMHIGALGVSAIVDTPERHRNEHKP